MHPAQVARYTRPLSGPLLDRLDIRLHVDPPHPGAVLCQATRRQELRAVMEAGPLAALGE